MKRLLLLSLIITSALTAKVYDGFLFFNEFEILKIRLAELDDVVDHFILVESVENFRGKPKPLYFEESKEQFAPYLDKIIHIVVERHPELATWPREAFQRDCIGRGLIDADDFDLIMVSDVDEIPRKERVEEAIAFLEDNPKQMIAFYQRSFHYKMNLLFDYHFPGTVATSVRIFQKFGAERVREGRRTPTIYSTYWFEDAGWHFSSAGTKENLEIKYNNFSHEELTGKAQERISEFFSKGTIIPIDDSYPQYVQDNIEYLQESGFILDFD